MDELQERLERKDHEGVFHSLDEVHLGTAVEILGTFAGRGSRFRPRTGRHQSGVELDRKALADLAVHDHQAFGELVKIAAAAR